MTKSPDSFPLPTYQQELIDFLSARRSNLAKVMGGPGPDAQTRDKILKIGTRVPDHRKLAPWRFMIFEGAARADFGQHIASAFMAANPEAPADRAIFEGARLTRAPLVIAVISSPKDCPRGTPKWEQELSSGAVCFNLCLAAQAHGFGAQWLTEWYAYDSAVNTALGLQEGERISGFVYIGTPQAQAVERARPSLGNVMKIWGNT